MYHPDISYAHPRVEKLEGTKADNQRAYSSIAVPPFFPRRRSAPAQHKVRWLRHKTRPLASKDIETRTTRPSHHKPSHRITSQPSSRSDAG